jgi:hypothetical protein
MRQEPAAQVLAIARGQRRPFECQAEVIGGLVFAGAGKERESRFDGSHEDGDGRQRGDRGDEQSHVLRPLLFSGMCRSGSMPFV